MSYIYKTTRMTNNITIIKKDHHSLKVFELKMMSNILYI